MRAIAAFAVGTMAAQEEFVAKKTDESEAITEQIFDHLVSLAAFELDEEQAKYLRGELNHQLRAIRELEAIPIEDDVPITSHGVPYTEQSRPELRQDQIVPCQEAEDILKQAPEVQNRYIVVPDLPKLELE
jgi:aspartyl/glutamyl-tRNA(Asn/Gln) amidotransferase C subunit